MTAVASPGRARKQETRKHWVFTLASGNVAWKGARAAYNPSTEKVVPASSAAGLMVLGVFDEHVDATSVAKPVNVDLETEIVAEWWANATSTDAVASTDIGKLCYMVDDATVSITSTGKSVAGTIVDVHATKGVLVAKAPFGGAVASLSALPSSTAFTSNDSAPSSLTNGAIYDVPTTAAASTITLPAAAADGTIVYFAADGTKNAHTVQYRDATGPTNLTTALTASKRHLVVCAKQNGKWFANAYVSP